jgi:hypothetical protein
VWGPMRQNSIRGISVNPSQRESLLSTFQKPQTPDNERLSSLDEMYLQQFHALWPQSCWGPLLFPSRLGSQMGVQLHNVALGSLSLTSYRSAVLVFMSYYNRNEFRKTFGYLAKYHTEAQNAINVASIFEVTIATYVVAVYSLIGGDSMQMALSNCQQFCCSVVAFAMSRMCTDEWIETLWQDVLSSLYHVHRDSILFNQPSKPLAESFEQLYQLLHISAQVLPSDDDISNLPLLMTTEQICPKVRSLSIYLQYCLDDLLFQAVSETGPDRTKFLVGEFRIILDRLTRLITCLPNISDFIQQAYSSRSKTDSNYHGPETPNAFLRLPNVRPRGIKSVDDPKNRDTVLALLYAFARLLKNILDPAADSDEKVMNDIYSSAIALCRLVASFPYRSLNSSMVTLVVKRSLFWAGMILTESKFPAGDYLHCPF